MDKNQTSNENTRKISKTKQKFLFESYRAIEVTPDQILNGFVQRSKTKTKNVLVKFIWILKQLFILLYLIIFYSDKASMVSRIT